MKTIWKYPLRLTDYQMVEMPEGACVLAVQVQKDVPCLWALVEDSARKVQRSFRIVGTGHDAMGVRGDSYIGSFQMSDGVLVFHVFERKEEPV
jgi:hypothetical protein